VATVVEPEAPPASRTMLFERRVAVWPWTAAGRPFVAVQVEVPFQSSVLLSEALPLEPATTSTWPFFTMDDGSRVAVWS
jgi:hypothetical protein